MKHFCYQVLVGLLLIIFPASIIGCEEQERQDTALGNESTAVSNQGPVTSETTPLFITGMRAAREDALGYDSGVISEDQAARSLENDTNTNCATSARDDIHYQLLWITQQRETVFSEMSWEEGHYTNENERAIGIQLQQNLINVWEAVEPLNIDTDDKVRPLSELIFDTMVSDEIRKDAVECIGYTRSTMAIATLRAMSHYPTIDVRREAINGLYLCNDRERALQEMMFLNEQGVSFVIPSIQRNAPGDPTTDLVAKPYLIKLLSMKNDLTRIMAAYYLYYCGETAIARDVALEIRNKNLPVHQGIYDDNSRTMGWVNLILMDAQ